MSKPKYGTWQISLNPKDGVTDDQIKGVLKWIQKSSNYALVVTEKLDNQRHIHAGMWMHTACNKDNLKRTFLSLACLKDLTKEERYAFGHGNKNPGIMYNSVFVDKYLDKDDDTVVLLDTLPYIDGEIDWDTLEPFFPEKDDQRSKKVFLGDPGLLHLEKLYAQYMPDQPINSDNVGIFMWNMRFHHRKINVLKTRALRKEQDVNILNFLFGADNCRTDSFEFQKQLSGYEDVLTAPEDFFQSF